MGRALLQFWEGFANVDPNVDPIDSVAESWRPKVPKSILDEQDTIAKWLKLKKTGVVVVGDGRNVLRSKWW